MTRALRPGSLADSLVVALPSDDSDAFDEDIEWNSTDDSVTLISGRSSASILSVDSLQRPEGVQNEHRKREYWIMIVISILSCVTFLFLRKSIIFYNVAKSISNIKIESVEMCLKDGCVHVTVPIKSTIGYVSPVDVTLAKAYISIIYKDKTYLKLKLDPVSLKASCTADFKASFTFKLSESHILEFLKLTNQKMNLSENFKISLNGPVSTSEFFGFSKNLSFSIDFFLKFKELYEGIKEIIEYFRDMMSYATFENDRKGFEVENSVLHDHVSIRLKSVPSALFGNGLGIPWSVRVDSPHLFQIGHSQHFFVYFHALMFDSTSNATVTDVCELKMFPVGQNFDNSIILHDFAFLEMASLESELLSRLDTTFSFDGGYQIFDDGLGFTVFGPLMLRSTPDILRSVKFANPLSLQFSFFINEELFFAVTVTLKSVPNYEDCESYLEVGFRAKNNFAAVESWISSPSFASSLELLGERHNIAVNPGLFPKLKLNIKRCKSNGILIKLPHVSFSLLNTEKNIRLIGCSAKNFSVVFNPETFVLAANFGEIYEIFSEATFDHMKFFESFFAGTFVINSQPTTQNMIDFFALFYRLINAAEDIPSLLIASKRHIIKFVQNNIDTSNIGVLFTSATQALLTPPSGSVTEEITQLSSKLRLFTSIMIKACRAPAADPQFIKELFDTLFPVILNPVNQVSFDDLSQACFISKTILQMIEGIKKQTIEFLKKMWNSDSKIPSLEQLKSLQKEYIPNFADMPSESATGLAALFAIFTMKFGKTLLLTFNAETQSLVVKPEFQDLVISVSEIVLNPLRAAIDSIKFSSFKELQSSIFSIENGISMDDMPELICGALEHLIGNILDSLDTTVKCTILAEVSSLPLGAPVNHFITKVFTYSGVSILKLLQLLAEKIIDESTRSMFAIFKSDLPPMPVSELREIVLNSTPVGSTWRVPDELNVDPQLCIDRPDGYLTVFIKTCGSGTISEGHFGLLSRSIDVFVKVAKEESYERFVNQESRLINAVCLDHRFASVKEPFEQIEKSFLREFDLEAEVRNIQMGYVTYHAPQKSIYVPKHLLHFTHRGRVNMIVTEKAPGVPLVSFEFVRRDCTPQQNLDRLVEVHRILSALYADFLITAFFEKGFFHGDMHAGNIMIHEEAIGSKPTYKLSLIDFGNSHRLNDELTIGLLKISMGVLAHNSLCVIEGLGYNANSPDRRRIWMKVQRDLDHYFEYCDKKKIDREKYFVETLNKSSVWTYFQEIEEVFVGEIEVCISWLPAATLTFIKGTLKNLHDLVRCMKNEARYEYVPLILMEYRRLYAHISIVVRPALDTSDDEACEIIHLLNALQLYCVERMAMLRRVSLRHYQQLCLPFPCVGRFLRDLMLVSQLDRAIFEHVKGLAKREPTLVRFQQPFEPNGWVDSEYTLLKTKLLTMFPAFKFPASQNTEALTQETVETATDLDPLVALLEYVRFKHDETSNADPLFRDAAAVRAANDALATVKASCGVIRTLRFAKIHMSHFLANVSREMSAYRSLKDKVRRKVICSDIVLANHLAEARKAFLTYRRNTFAPEFRSGMAMIVVSQTPGLDMLKNDTTSVFDFFRAQKLLVDMLDGIRAKALDIDLEMKNEQFADPSAVAINANMGFGDGRGKVMRVALRNSLGLLRHSLSSMPKLYWNAAKLTVANHFSRLMSYFLADER